MSQRKDTRTKPGKIDCRNWLHSRPAYKRIDLADYERPERWEGDVEITSTGTFEFIDGQHVMTGKTVLEVGRG